MGGLRSAAAGLLRSTGWALLRSLNGLLLLLLIVDLVALPLAASLHGQGAPLSDPHGWHIGQDRLHIEPDGGHPDAELLDHSALRPVTSIRPYANPAGSDAWAEDEPSPAWPPSAAALIALLGAWSALGARGALGRAALHAAQPLAGRGAVPAGLPPLSGSRPWRGPCPARQAPPPA